MFHSFSQFRTIRLVAASHRALAELNDLLPYDKTKNPLINSFIQQLSTSPIRFPQLATTYRQICFLIEGLKIAKETIDYMSGLKIVATNTPDSSEYVVALERQRSMVNAQLTDFYKALRERRAEKNLGAITYRRGVGTHMRLWSQRIYKNCKSRQGYSLGNCTEQASFAFNYVYGRVCEEISAANPPPILRVERVDVENRIGGHSKILLNRDKNSFARLPIAQKFSMSLFLENSCNFGPFCIVIDPWNKNCPYYLIADIHECAPKVGLEGVVNFELGLDFSSSQPTLPQAQLSCRL